MNLRIFTSDRCDMACDYCWLSLNRGPAVVLDEALARRAVREHRQAHGARARVTVLGGEPLIYPNLVRAIVEEARGLPIAIATNGARARPAVLEELARRGVELVLSLDGAAESHDAHRRLAGSSRPSHERVLRARGGCRAPVRVNMVVKADTAAVLPRNVEYLRARGFRRLSFHLDVLEPWTPSSLATLAAALEGFGRYWRALPPGALALTHLGARPGLERDGDLILGADGRYYPCDGLFARRYAELGDWTVGDARAGVDWAARERLLQDARRAIAALSDGGAGQGDPREAYFHARATGGDPGEAVRRFERAHRIFDRALSALAAGAEAAA